MKSNARAQGFLSNARLILEEAQDSLAKRHYHRTLRKCQEAVELALKSYLLFLGLDYPRVHDVAPQVQEAASRLRLASEAELQQLAKASARLRAKRELAFYGDDDGTPPQQLFDRTDAQQAINDGSMVLEFVTRAMAGPRPT